METTVKELPDSRVRVDVDVDPQDVEGSIAAHRAAARPGHEAAGLSQGQGAARDGRAAARPRDRADPGARVVARRLVRARACSPRASTRSAIPKLDLSDLPEEGKPLRFSIEVARPARAPSSASTRASRSAAPSRRCPTRPSRPRSTACARDSPGSIRSSVRRTEDDVAADRLRGQDRRRALRGRRGPRLPPGAGRGTGPARASRQRLAGAEAGDERQVSVTFPDDYPRRGAGRQDAEFDVKVKEVREKELPELDDDFASEASEFDTLDELRDDIAERSGRSSTTRSPSASARTPSTPPPTKAKVDLPDAVVQREGRGDVAAGRAPAAPAGDGPGELSADPGQEPRGDDRAGRPDAERALKREAVLEAVADAEDIEITEEDELEALQIPPGHEDHGHPEPADALRRSASRGARSSSRRTCGCAGRSN